MKKSLAIGLCLILAACVTAPAPQPKPSPKSDRAQVQQTMEQADQALRDARLTDAEVLYRELTKTDPQLPEVWLRLGNVYMREGQPQAAVHTYTQGLHYTRDDGRLWYNLALARLKQSVDTLEASSQMLPANSPYRPRIQALHEALLSTGRK